MEFKLSDNFIDKYKRRKAPFGFNGLGELVYMRTYSRLKEDGSNEKWWETVRRVVEGTYSMQKRWIEHHQLGWNPWQAQSSAQEMYERIWSMKFLPPGRGLWSMGTDMIETKGLHAALNNCFSKDTEFLTDKGTVNMSDSLGKSLNVLCPDGLYRQATVNEFGEQELYAIKLKPVGLRSNLEINVQATKDHRWILSDGKVTTNIKKGDLLQASEHTATTRDNTGFAHGLIFGDGTRHTHYPDRHLITICDGNEETYIPILKQVKGYRSITGRTKSNPYPIVTIVRPQENWKTLPLNKDNAYIASFIEGWLAADSWDKPSGTKCLDTQSAEAAEWLKLNAPIGGYVATGHTLDSAATNFGKRKAPLNRISLSSNKINFIVKDIKKTGLKETVYCVSEPETKSFVLAGGIPTGNCAFVSTETLKQDGSKPFTFLMDASMLGVGVGFDTKGAGTLEVKGPSNKEPIAFIIPDTREGWVEATGMVIDSYFNGTPVVVLDYSLIRKAREPIKGFGGVASGPEPLQDLHTSIRDILGKNIGKAISTTTIVDIQNFIGKCVVAGNVRRTAEIVFGDPHSDEYLDLKNYEVNPERADFGWTSNNSVFAELGMDYSNVCDRVMRNGEPGFAWLENMQAYSRMRNGQDWKDHRVTGGNPCLEQSLESYELCCLVETFPTNHASLEDYLKTLKYAYLYAKTVTLGKTQWSETNRVMLRNRRIGTSVSGVAQFVQGRGIHVFKEWLEAGYDSLQEYDKKYSDWLAVPRSVKTTSVKPSGTVSLLAGATPGLHFPESRFYIRRMRLSKYSELVAPLEKAGYKLEPAVGSEETTLVVEIPVDVGEGIRTVSEVSMWEQLSIAAFMQKYWADNQVSCTVTFDPDTEGEQLKHALNYFQYQLKGISFLPKLEHGAYPQMPYEAIDESTYTHMLSGLGKLSFSNIKGEEADIEKFCGNDTCESAIEIEGATQAPH